MKVAVDLNNLIASEGLDKAEIAVQLFPDNKYPKLALYRILRGESALDVNQLSKLSAMTGMSVEALFSGGWRKTSDRGKLIFERGDYKAVFDQVTKVTGIYHKSSLAHEFVYHTESITLSKYLEELEIQIQKLKWN